MAHSQTTTKMTSKNNHFIRISQAFEKLIEEQGYSMQTVSRYRNSANLLCERLALIGHGILDLTDELSEELISGLIKNESAARKKYAKYRFERFRDYLIEYENAPKRSILPTDTSVRARLRQEYEIYLKEQRGLAISTIEHCLRFYDLFITYMFGGEFGSLHDIKTENIISFVLQRKNGAPRDKTIPSHLRSLFKFLFWAGHTKCDLSQSIPRAKQPKPTNIPRYLPPNEVERLITASKGNRLTGRRNHAMLLIVARLGLRATEVVAIELGDIDWRNGEILIRGKGHRRERMPLPKDVGEAIVDYIQNERRGSERVLFVSGKPPFKKFKDAKILGYILNDIYDITKIMPPQSYVGSHILRHSLATSMLKNGASLEEISDVLRHRSRMTTTIYAQYDTEALRGLARPWPTKEGGAQ